MVKCTYLWSSVVTTEVQIKTARERTHNLCHTDECHKISGPKIWLNSSSYLRGNWGNCLSMNAIFWETSTYYTFCGRCRPHGCDALPACDRHMVMLPITAEWDKHYSKCSLYPRTKYLFRLSCHRRFSRTTFPSFQLISPQETTASLPV